MYDGGIFNVGTTYDNLYEPIITIKFLSHDKMQDPPYKFSRRHRNEANNTISVSRGSYEE